MPGHSPVQKKSSTNAALICAVCQQLLLADQDHRVGLLWPAKSSLEYLCTAAVAKKYILTEEDWGLNVSVVYNWHYCNCPVPTAHSLWRSAHATCLGGDNQTLRKWKRQTPQHILETSEKDAILQSLLRQLSPMKLIGILQELALQDMATRFLNLECFKKKLEA